MTLLEALNKKLAEASATTGVTWAERIAEVLVKEAMGGNFEATRMILQRLESPMAVHEATRLLSHPDDD